ncbi:MAG: hydroxyethylthiazole kinase [Methanobrevibacter sp.]|jgi:hydroxyethylthiazole kinase|nr:hydroxyethylthiazole kinase [Candidatus Methanoflexus mossambicus]
MNNYKNKLISEVISTVKKIKTENPLTICLTNAVTINDCANAILAINGSPAMTDYDKDIGDLVKIAKSLVINLGMLNDDKIKGIYEGCTVANQFNIPIVIDPVAVGVTTNRNELILDLIAKFDISAIRGNISEIKSIAKLLNLKEIEKLEINTAKGVDASENDLVNKNNLKQYTKIVEELSKYTNSVIIASGPIDIISNGKTSYAIENGDEMATKITGSGCMLTSIVGSYIGVSNPLTGAITGSLIMAIAEEQAKEYVDKDKSGTGTFRVKLIDYLSLMDDKTIKTYSRINNVLND